MVKIFERQGHYTQVDDHVFDVIMRTLSGAEFKVLLFIIRKTRGWNKPADYISYSQIVEYCGISRTSVHRAVKGLQNAGLIVAQKEEGFMAMYALNSNYEADVVSKAHQGGSKSVRGVVPKVYQGGSKSVPTIDTLQETEEIYINSNQQDKADIVTALCKVARKAGPTDVDTMEAADWLLDQDATPEGVLEFAEWWKPFGDGKPWLKQFVAFWDDYENGRVPFFAKDKSTVTVEQSEDGGYYV